MRFVFVPVRLLTIVAFSAIILLAFSFRGDNALTKIKENVMVAPNLSATKTSALDSSAGGDLNGNGVVNPGDRLTYTVTINNTGADPATGVNFSDTLDANTTFVSGSVIASPIAVNDAYTSIGNVGINIPDGANDLLANDLNPNGGGTLTITFAPTVSAQGGNVSINTTTGAFTYNPAPGFEGTDSFTYTLSNGTGLTDNAIVSIQVSGMIWFINSAAATNGDGRLGTPFNCYTGTGCFSAVAADDAGDNIFLYSGNYTGGYTLLNNQKLIGQGASATLATVAGIVTIPPFSNALPATGGTNPTVTTLAASTNAVNLGQGNSIRGLTLGNTTGADIAGTNFGALSISEVTLNGTGQALNLNTGTLTATFQSISSTNSASTGITLQNLAASSALTVAGGTTIDNPAAGSNSITINTVGNGSTLSFGTTNLTNRKNTGIFIDSAQGMISFGAVTIANPNNAGGYGIRVEDSSAAVTVASATISNANLVTAQNDSDSNGFPDTDGDGDAIFLINNTGSFTLNGGALSNCGNDCVDVRNSSNFNITGVTITAPGQDVTGATGEGFGGHGIQGINLTGANTISGTTISGFNVANRSGLVVNSNTGTMMLGVTGSTFQNATGNTGATSLVNGTANVTLTVGGATNNVSTNCTFSNISASAIVFRSAGTGTLNTTIQNSTFQNAPLNGKTNITGGATESATGNFTIINNTFNNVFRTASTGEALISLVGGNTGGANTFGVNVSGNTINGVGQNSTACGAGATYCGGPLEAILVFVDGSTDANGTIQINNNNLTNVQQGGIVLDIANAAGGNVDAKITGNTLGTNAAPVGAGSGSSITLQNGIRVLRRRVGGQSANVLVSNNTIRNGNATAVTTRNGTGIYVRGESDTTASVTLQNNNIDTLNSNPEIIVESNSPAVGDPATQTLCSDINGNAVNGGSISLIETEGTLNIEQGPTSAAVSSANGGATINVTGAPSFGISCAAPPSIAEPFDENESVMSDAEKGTVKFITSALFQTPSDMLASIEPFINNSINAETLLKTEIAQTKTTIQAIGSVSASEAIENQENNYRAAVSNFFNDTSATSSDLAGKFDSFIMPTVSAQELRNTATEIKSEQLAPLSGETVTKSLGTLPAGEQIVVQFKATVDANIPTNDFSVENTANITAAGGININSTTATTTVVQPPTISKAFGSTFLGVNGTTTLTFTIGNANPSTNFTNVAFTDTLPAGLIVANPNGLVNNCGSGTVTAVAGLNSISVSALSRNAATSCTIVVNVTANSEGAKNNVTGAISSTQGGTGLTASATLNVIAAPTFTKSFGASSIQLNGTTTLSFAITNASATFPLNNVSFTDNLVAGLVVATPPNQVGMCGGGTITANAGASSISLAGATIAANTNCTFSVNVTGTSAGVKNNSVTLSTTELGSTPTATASINVIAPPTIAKAFSPTSIASGGSSTVTLTLTNPNATDTLTGASFTDTLANMSAAGGAVGGTCAGTTPATLSAGATALSFSGITIPAGGSCTVTFAVTSTTAGNHPNTTSGVTTAQTPTAGQASNTATLTVVAPPQIAKSFSPTSISVNGNSTLTITITNPSANTVALTGVVVTDAFPAGLEVDATPTATNSCSTGTFAPVAGATSVSISGATIPVNTTCTFSVKVKATTVGAKNNVTGNVTSTEGGTGATAAATLTVTNVSYESDVAPRPDGSGDGFVNVGDITQVRRFVAGLDLPYQSNEFQRVDAAPLNSLGDGFVNAGDVTQVRRYAAGLDAVQPAGGPTAPTPPPVNNLTEEETEESLADVVDDQISNQEDAANADKPSNTERANKVIAAPREMRPTRVSLVGNVLTVAVNLQTDAADTPANAVGFTLQFDTNVLSNPTNIRLGANAPAATTITENTTQAAMGRVGIVLDLPVSPAQTFPTGDAQLVLIDFTVVAMPPASTTISFGDTPVQRFVGDINGNALTTTFSSGSISLLPVTAASVTVGGRVVTTNGRGINKALVTLTDQNGNTRQAITNPFGFYRFADVQAGQVVVLSIRHKQYQFEQPTIVLQVNEELMEANFVAFCVICHKTR